VTPVVGTAVAVHELALARVLAAGLERVHPDWRLTVLLLDGDPEDVADERFEAVGLAEIGASGLGLLQTVAGSSRVLGAALRPALLAHLADRSDDVATWLDPTVRVLGSLDALVEAADAGVALVPLHPTLEPGRGLAVRAPFESGMVAATDSVALRWWGELTLERARALGSRFDPEASDCLGALVAASPDVRTVRDPSLCAGWWSLEARPLDGDLRALNLPGFDPAKPHWVSAEDRDGAARVSSSAELAELLADHAGELLAAGWKPAFEPWAYATLPNGLALDDDMRDLFALAQRRDVPLESPFTDAGCDAFMRWLDSECPIGAGVTWYLERVHRRRPDLRAAFPDLGGGDGRRLARWMETNGLGEERVLAELLRRRPGPARSNGDAVSAARAAGGAARVRVIGYLGDGLGLGQAARSYVRALRAVGVEVETATVPAPMSGRDRDRFWTRRDVEWETGAEPAGPVAVEIVCMNPPELVRACRTGVVSAERNRRIGVWAWELDSLPTDWADAFPLVDEVWAYSEYVAQALRPSVPVPVEVMPLAIDIPDRHDDSAVETAPFTFLFVFDLMSSIERKNPLGLIEAFKRAFEPGEGPRLLLKTSNGDNQPEQLERVKVAAIDRPDIDVVDEFMSAPERDALIASCDCYVSLHRAEGFGLTIAEAMAAGRPTIATGFSGNLDFTAEDCAHLVRWTAATVEDGDAIYPAGARWAEPDVDHAAALMRGVYGERSAARALGRRGRDHVAALLSPEVVGQLLRDHIATARTPSRGRIRATLARRVRG